MIKMKNVLIIIVVLSLLVLAGNIWFVSRGTRASVPENGLIQGAVTIGPITPVEQPGQCLPVSPEVFASRKVMIYDESGQKLLQQVDINQIDQTANGYYAILIAPGTYTVDINHNGIDSAANLPQKVTVSAGETVIVDINIDTGIR
jgi:hypothetical protein